MKLILGSSSKYKKGILEKAGYTFETINPDVDEMSIRSDDYYQLPLLLAQAKANSLMSKVADAAILISADIVVICDGKLYEKPESADEVRAWLKKYGDGYPAETACGMVVVNTETGKRAEGIDICKVYFSPLPREVVEEFILNGDPFSKAGGFSIQYPALRQHIHKVEGTSESITGMPLHLLEKLLAQVSSI
jgi:septum formation protein